MPKGIRQGKSEQKYKAHYTEKDYYKYYIDTYCKHKGKVLNNNYYVSKQFYYNIVKDINKMIADKMVIKGNDFLLPCRLGEFAIRKNKPKSRIDKDGTFKNRLPIDWNATLLLWENNVKAKERKILVRHYNQHSKGYCVRFKFLKHKAKFKYSRNYSFIACRTMKINLAKEYKKDTVDYLME